MKSFLQTLKNHLILIFSLVLLEINDYFLFQNLTFALVSSITCLVLSLAALFYADKKEKQIQTIRSSFSFLYSFLNCLESGMGSKSSYDSAARYLIGYQTFTDYEEEKQNKAIKVFRFQKYYEYLLEEDNQNELTLLYFRSLIHLCQEKILLIDKYSQKKNKDTIFSFSILLSVSFLFHLLVVIFPDLNYGNSVVYLVLAFLFSSFSMPLLLLNQKENDGGLIQCLAK